MLLILLLPIQMLAAPAALALKSDREQAVDLTADQLDGVIADDGSTRIWGNVVITQGSLKIQSAEAVVERRKGALVHATLSGELASVEQALDGGGTMRSVARKIEYDITDQVLLLTGAVVVQQPEGELRGERIRYDIESGHLEGGGEGGRINLKIPPAPAKPKPKA